ncbi:NAD(P)H-hydrate epimerase [Candidatus Velamenicoccus archaeovorus]|uniref:NAD(P)H-hydrate epimerase n=1 Tax=Velamenicoccus archaeovorus TaxID=1930593 RepID=A0A410P373_VELA1|nr:NAD(P)H-hydrate epimerase [Candidatus Velamenicoccus archaeovorus]QAT16645.1 NAD(P)H-hydrate epimerase [Candidatus Velamenicoccus archaeovorus]
MQKYITPAAMQRLDRLAEERYGIPPLILMENAGRSAAEAVIRLLKGKRKRVVCVAGRGNNGGDGFVCCRHLLNKGVRVEAFLMDGKKALTPDARLNRDILEKSGCPVRRVATPADVRLLRQSLKRRACVVDAIFGIGFRGAPRTPYDEVIAVINASGSPVVSLDVPSGLDALTGRAHGACIRASATVTFGYPKTGLARHDGPLCAGRILVADISLPR